MTMIASASASMADRASNVSELGIAGRGAAGVIALGTRMPEYTAAEVASSGTTCSAQSDLIQACVKLRRRARPLLAVFREGPHHEIRELMRDVRLRRLRRDRILFQDCGDKRHRRGCGEWHSAHQAFVKHDARGVKIRAHVELVPQ